jgi:hypothetical protein
VGIVGVRTVRESADELRRDAPVRLFQDLVEALLRDAESGAGLARLEAPASDAHDFAPFHG